MSHPAFYTTSSGESTLDCKVQRADPYAWPAFPLLASTQFCMEVLLRGSVLDLRSVREVLTFDPCALLRIFAATAQEFADPDDRPQHLDECIVSLGTHGLIRALEYTGSTWEQQARLSSFAERSVALAGWAQTTAPALGLPPEKAYLLGLLHDVGRLPAELGWVPSAISRAEHFAITAWVTEQYKLPPDLLQAILSVQNAQQPSAWSVLLRMAHHKAVNTRSSVQPQFPSSATNENLSR